jgi:hypothetical protein
MMSSFVVELGSLTETWTFEVFVGDFGEAYVLSDRDGRRNFWRKLVLGKDFRRQLRMRLMQVGT